MEEPKKKRVLPIVGLVLVAILVVSLASYAYWQVTEKQTNKNVVGTACLNISFSGSNDIKLENAWPISDSEGSETTPYTFTIENHCDDSINYQVALESLAAQEGESSNYLDYRYLKVKLNDNEAALYEDLTDITPESGIRDTKELAHHTLAGKGNITYNLRLWIDEDTSLQNEDESYNTEKFFYGKVKVIAGPNVEGDIALKLLTDPNEPVATLSNISIGDRVGYESEQFYVIGIDGNNVKLLSRYLINVGNYQNQNVTSGLQSAELGYTRPDITDPYSREIYFFAPDEGICYGAVSFSDDNYWYDNSNNTWVSPYTANSFVYNENASISNYVNGYVQTLQKMGLSVTNGTLLSLEELSTLCNTNISSAGEYSSQCPNYIIETTYWLGSADDYSFVWFVNADGLLNGSYYGDYHSIGVRPVITVSLS